MTRLSQNMIQLTKDAPMDSDKRVRGKGRLVVVGSGIKAVGQFTLEAQAHIQQADIVLYAAADPVTDMWISKQNPNTFDLYQYYGNDKSRIVTYVQMIERILDEVRAGRYVCAIFYGHPGVFVTPSHNAVELARREGYEAQMLPAISAEDCLYADLGVDPSITGLQVFEATDLLLRQRRIEPTMNMILFQVGCVGDLGFNFQGYENNNFGILVDYLEKAYGPDQEVINYVASMFSIAEPTIARHRISDLRKPDVTKTITGISTFFFPAAKEAVVDEETAGKFGLKAARSPRTSLVCDRADYPKLKIVAQRNNKKHAVPPGYKFSHASQQLYDTLLDLSLNIESQRAFQDDPEGFLNAREGLNESERRYLRMRHLGIIRMMFKADPAKEAQRFVDHALGRPYLADSYRAKQMVESNALMRGEIEPSQYQAAMCDWLMEQGYATTPAAVTQAIEAVRLVRADAQVIDQAEPTGSGQKEAVA
jgi:precorrin-2 methylase